jgi:hypothetical protein
MSADPDVCPASVIASLGRLVDRPVSCGGKAVVTWKAGRWTPFWRLRITGEFSVLEEVRIAKSFDVSSLSFASSGISRETRLQKRMPTIRPRISLVRMGYRTDREVVLYRRYRVNSTPENWLNPLIAERFADRDQAPKRSVDTRWAPLENSRAETRLRPSGCANSSRREVSSPHAMKIPPSSVRTAPGASL